jgi:O-antigen/teichoic acid export membrane protein
MRPLEATIVVARSAAVMAAVFGSVVAMLYLSLVLWDRTHPPSMPGWSAAPVVHPARSSDATRHA